MKIGIASHIVLDTIKQAEGSLVESLGGPACYCGITSKRFGFDVDLATRVGSDFPEIKRLMLLNSGIVIKDSHIVDDAQTTRFSISKQGDSRQLILHSKCAQLSSNEIKNMNVDCWLVSPVFDEVPIDVLDTIKQKSCKENSFVMLDPQGYLRKVDDYGEISLVDRLELDLSGISAIKVDEEEMFALTGGLQYIEGMQLLQSYGVEFVISTSASAIHLLHKKTHYWIKIKEINTPDSTGAGDILCASFCCAYLKEKDPLWAFCFGAGAVRAALETGLFGLAKIPPMAKIEQNASYYYNTVGFKHL